MFGPLGFQELLFIFALALLIFGPKKLPQIGRTLGRGLAEFRKASNDLRRTINAEMIEQELRDSDPRRAVKDSLQDLKRGLDDEEPTSASAGDDSGGAIEDSVAEDSAVDDSAREDSAADDSMADDSIAATGAAGTVARGSARGPAAVDSSASATASETPAARRNDESMP